jgi:hypothetical protein
MPSFSPALIQTMRAALDEVMTKIPLEQATPGIKAALAECILKTAAGGQTSFEGLVAARLGPNSGHSFDAGLSAGRGARCPATTGPYSACWRFGRL